MCLIVLFLILGYHNKYDHDHSSYYKKNGTEYIGNEGTYNFTGFYSYENISVSCSYLIKGRY